MKATEAKLLEFLKKSPQFVLPYVIGLVRQSLEKQLGNGGDS